MARLEVTREQANGGWLPVCACCGAPAEHWRTQTWWIPPSFYYAVSLPFLAVFIVGLKRCRITLPFCRQHHRHWFVRNVVGALSLAAAALVWGGALWASWLTRHNDTARSWVQHLETLVHPVYGLSLGVMVLLVLVFGALLLAALQESAIQPLHSTRTHVLLGRLSEDFVRQHRNEVDGEEG